MIPLRRYNLLRVLQTELSAEHAEHPSDAAVALYDAITVYLGGVVDATFFELEKRPTIGNDEGGLRRDRVDDGARRDEP